MQERPAGNRGSVAAAHCVKAPLAMWKEQILKCEMSEDCNKDAVALATTVNGQLVRVPACLDAVDELVKLQLEMPQFFYHLARLDSDG